MTHPCKMTRETEQEVYDLADEALAHLRSIETEDSGRATASQVATNLERIRRRTDPARYDDGRIER